MKELKATDLRVGNYVTHCDYTDGIFKVESITYQEDAVGGYVIDTIGGKNGTWINPIDCVEPIELTPEIFDKCGLKYIQNACWEFGSMRIYNLSEESKPRFRITLAGNELTVIKYVHELQNLYFALTGQELEVKF